MKDIYLYGEVGRSFWSSDWFSADELRKELDGAEDVTLHVNSPGGDVFEGVTIAAMISAHRSKGNRVNVVVDGLAASAASFMILGADQVRMSKGAFLMIHDPSGFCQGTAADMRKQADALDKVRDTIVGFYTARTGKAHEELAEAMRAETWYSDDEAVAEGFADIVEQAPCRVLDLAAPLMNSLGRVPEGVPVRLQPADKAPSEEKEAPAERSETKTEAEEPAKWVLSDGTIYRA